MKKDGGFVLVTGMIFVLILTMLVLYMLRGATLEERMASNAINHQRAFQAAEAVLREGETLIVTSLPFDPFQISSFTTTCNNGYCRGLTADAWKTFAWSGSTSKQSSLTLSGNSQSPRYVIELIDPPVWKDGEGCSIATYRIIAKGWGQDGSESVVQSHVRFSPKQCR